MKSTKKLFLALILTAFTVLLGFGVVACDNGGDHTHTFDTSYWENDENTHWHKATCEHTAVRGDEAPHIDENDDRLCDVCGRELGSGSGKEHTHTFDTSYWEKDENTHWHKATCEHTTVRGDEAPHIDEDGDQFCDVCEAFIEHKHKFSETEWKFDEESHWRPAVCHPEEKGSEAAHNFINGTCECGVKEVEKTAYIELIEREILNGQEIDFYTWLTGIKADGVTDVRITEKGDIIYDRSGTVEGVFVNERTVKVKAVDKDKNGGLADVWFKVSMSENGSYHIVKDNSDALTVGKTDANGEATLTFTPIGGYSSSKIKYEILLAQALDVAVCNGVDEDEVKIYPDRYSLKDESDFASLGEVEVGETDETGANNIAGTLEFVSDMSWSASEKRMLNYLRYYEEPNKEVSPDVQPIEEGQTTNFVSSGNNVFDYLTFSPAHNYDWSSGNTSEQFDIIAENYRNSASGIYRISFKAESLNEADSPNARLYYWNGNLDLPQNQKPDDGTPTDNLVESVSGSAFGEIKGSAFTNGDYVEVVIDPEYGLEVFALGFICDAACNVTITVERTGDYTNIIDSVLTVGENTNDGKGYTLKAYNTLRLPIDEGISAGLYMIKLTSSIGCFAGSLQVYTKETDKCLMAAGSAAYDGIVRIEEDDEYLTIANRNKETFCEKLTVAEYTESVISDKFVMNVPASDKDAEEFKVKFASSTKFGATKIKVTLYSSYLMCEKINIKVGDKTYAEEALGNDKFYTKDIDIEIASGDTLTITSESKRPEFSKFYAEVKLGNASDKPGIKEGEDVRIDLVSTVKGSFGGYYDFAFAAEKSGTYKITLTLIESRVQYLDAKGQIPYYSDVAFVDIYEYHNKKVGKDILEATRSKLNSDEWKDDPPQQTATANFEMQGGEVLELRIWAHVDIIFSIRIDFVQNA